MSYYVVWLDHVLIQRHTSIARFVCLRLTPRRHRTSNPTLALNCVRLLSTVSPTAEPPTSANLSPTPTKSASKNTLEPGEIRAIGLTRYHTRVVRANTCACESSDVFHSGNWCPDLYQVKP
jgi:hypothetical protein